MDIVFGEYVVLGGHRYALLLVYFETRYFWLYEMSYLYSTPINSVLENFNSEAGQLPKLFHSGFDINLWVTKHYAGSLLTDQTLSLIHPAVNIPMD